MEIRNEGPFLAGLVLLLDSEGAERLCVAVRATYAINARGGLSLADEPPALSPMDVFLGDLATSRSWRPSPRSRG